MMKSQPNNYEDPRIQEVLNLIYELASGNLVARGTLSENDDYLDGIITGINMLADEIAQDITKRRRAEEVVKESEEKFSRAFHSNPHPMSIVTMAEGRYLDVNDSYVQTFGFSREELLGRTTVEMGIIKTGGFRERILESLKERQTVKNLEVELYTRSGRKVDALLSADKTELGGQTCLLSVITDITERKRVEGALRESEERFSQLYNGSPVGYHESDSEGRIIQVNQTELDMLGYTAKEMLGRHVWDFRVETDTSRQAFAAKMVGTMPPGRAFERTYRRKDGTTFPALLEGRYVKDESGQIIGLRSTIQDITERKQAEEKRTQLIQELQETLKEVRTLSGLLPICAWCKKLRDDEGYWKSVEQSIGERTKAKFTHGMCPECQLKFISEKNSNTKVS